jgi:hypothetical protein
VEGGSGFLPRPALKGGGEGVEGAGGTQHLSPAWGGNRSQGTPMV